MEPGQMKAEKVSVKPSRVHGKGVFASVPFRSGELVVEWANTKEITPQEYALLPQTERNYIEIQKGKTFLVGEPERYVNHSCQANTTQGPLGDVASREIAAGEEITADYSQFFLPNGPFRCQCGSSICRGLIEGIKAE